MALLEEVSDRGLGLPLAVGLAVAAVSAGPRLVKAGKPLIKGAIKGFFVVQARAKEMFAETGERLQDVYAEARHEYEEEMHAAKPEEHEIAECKAEEAAPKQAAERPSHAEKSKSGESEQA